MKSRFKRKCVTKATKYAAWDKTQGRCWYCGRAIGGVKSRNYVNAGSGQLDHQTPLCKGGADDISNIVLACSGCNRSKHKLDVNEFREVIRQSPWFFGRLVRALETWGSYPLGEFEDNMTNVYQSYINHFRKVGVKFYGETMHMELANNYVI